MYATNLDEQYTNIEKAKERGYNVLMLDGMLDSHFISTFEQKFEHTSFARVDSNTIDKLIEKEDVKKDSKLDDKQKEEVKKAFEDIIDKTHFNVEFSTLDEKEAPVEIIQNEWMRRYKEMNQMGGMPMWGDMPDNYTLMLNTNNAAIATLLDKPEEERKAVINQLYDLARLSKNLLKGKELSEFINRNFNTIK